MRTFISNTPRFFVKLFAVILSPIVRILMWAYKLVSKIFSVFCVAFAAVSAVCAGGMWFYFGFNRNVVILAGFVVASILARWLAKQLFVILIIAQETIEERASAPIRRHDPYYDCGYYVPEY